MMHAPATRAAVAPGREPVFAWKDFSRFVELHPVKTGWLVLWGHYTEAGREKYLHGNKTYVEFMGARRRLLDAVFELTKDLKLVAEAETLLSRTVLPRFHTGELPAEPI